MKVRTAVKRLCDTCRIVLRRGRVYVVCKANPKVRVKTEDELLKEGRESDTCVLLTPLPPLLLIFHP
jgi:ribosomal protein L36